MTARPVSIFTVSCAEHAYNDNGSEFGGYGSTAIATVPALAIRSRIVFVFGSMPTISDAVATQMRRVVVTIGFGPSSSATVASSAGWTSWTGAEVVGDGFVVTGVVV